MPGLLCRYMLQRLQYPRMLPPTIEQEVNLLILSWEKRTSVTGRIKDSSLLLNRYSSQSLLSTRDYCRYINTSGWAAPSAGQPSKNGLFASFLCLPLSVLFISQVKHHPPVSACHSDSENFTFWQGKQKMVFGLTVSLWFHLWAIPNINISVEISLNPSCTLWCL